MKFKVNLKSPALPFPHKWEKAVNSCHANLALRDDLLSHYAMAHKELGMEMIRFHGILSDQIGVYQENHAGAPGYFWRNVDAVYDRIINIGMRPFVELSSMPAALAAGDKRICHYGFNVNPPKNYRKWHDLIAAFTRHCRQRYGLKRLQEWYFEVWNEPNIDFWRGSRRDYYRLYDHSVEAIKSVHKSLRVGGPATARGEWIADFLRHCRTENFCTGAKSAPLDFISTHIYPTDIAFAEKNVKVNFMPTEYLQTVVKKVYEQVKQSRYSDLEIHWTEWNAAAGPYNQQLDGANNAAFICKTIAEVHEYVDSFAYWCVSDIYEEGGFHWQPFHGGFGLINVYNLPKASFNAFKLLHKLGHRRFPGVNESKPKPDTGMIVTKAAETFPILLYNYTHPQSKAEHFKVSIKLEGLEGNRYYCDWYSIDKNHGGSVYEFWRQQGSPAAIEAKDLSAYEKKAQLKVEQGLTALKPVKGVCRLDTFLPSATVKLGILRKG